MNVLKCTTRPWANAIAAASLALAGHMALAQVTIDWVTVGDPGNPADTTGYGAVAEEFRIGKHEITIGQYAEFLNAVAKSDPYSLYNPAMETDLNIRGILRSGASGSYEYSVVIPAGVTPAGASSSFNRPITYVSWFDAVRFANWMHNGQLTGSAGAASTETGAYTLFSGQTSGTAPARNPGAQFYIPTESQWYKAAYYKGGGLDAGYWDYATQSDADPGNTIGSGGNQANYYAGDYSVTQSSSGLSSSQNYLTDVGAFTNSASYYGTSDQNGNVSEWNDLDGAADSLRGLRGGLWGSSEFILSSAFRITFNPSVEDSGIGFRLAAPVPEPSTYALALAGLASGGYMVRRRQKRTIPRRLLLLIGGVTFTVASAAAPAGAQLVNYELVPVGDPGNAPDTTGYGAVPYEYQIGKYEVTIGQYTDFLNSVARSDTKNSYKTWIQNDGNVAGILRERLSGTNLYTYTADGPRGMIFPAADSPRDRPVTFVSWQDAARFANWMSNGQPTGGQNAATTENGAYNILNIGTGLAPVRNSINPNTGLPPTYFIPNENEWYKAAYYSPELNVGQGGYYAYATQSDTPPGNVIGSGTNQANYRTDSGYSVTQTSGYSGTQNYLTNVGAFAASTSYYGTFDQNGNALEWNDLGGSLSGIRGLRGGGWTTFFGLNLLASSLRNSARVGDAYAVVGFRLASSIADPVVVFNVAAGTTQTQQKAGMRDITSAKSVTKSGPGTLILDAANTYIGPTNIQQGVLGIASTSAVASSSLVNLSSGASFDVKGLTGGYTVSSGQTLAGAGTILGSVTFGAGSTLSPGLSIAAADRAMLASTELVTSPQAIVVPEPATLGLVGVGVGFLGYEALRRKRA